MITITALQLRALVRIALAGMPSDATVALREPLVHEAVDQGDVLVEIEDDLELWVAPPSGHVYRYDIKEDE